MSSTISLKLDLRTIRKIEILVRNGHFKTKSDVIRAAIKAKLARERTITTA